MSINNCNIVISTTTSSGDCPYGAYTPYEEGETTLNFTITKVKETIECFNLNNNLDYSTIKKLINK